MKVGQIWKKTTELPGKGRDFAKNNPWKTGGVAGALVLASALFVYYYKYPDSKYAGVINNVAGVTSNFVKANPTIILSACLAIAIIAIGFPAYKNNDRANKIDGVKEVLNREAVTLDVENPKTALDHIAKAIQWKAPVPGLGGNNS